MERNKRLKRYERAQFQYEAAKKIEHLMELIGIDEKELAKKTGVDVKHIRRYLTGDHCPSIFMVNKILNGLGVPLILFEMPDRARLPGGRDWRKGRKPIAEENRNGVR